MSLEQEIQKALGASVVSLQALGGGCVAEVYRVALADGRDIVVKRDGGPQPKLDIEAWMLRYLAAHSKLPVPEVLYSASNLLAMSYIEGDTRFCRPSQEHAADLLAELHQIKGKAFGLERDTLIGALHQPNPWTESWVDFFREHRLFAMTRQARDAGQLPVSFQRRIEALGARLPEFIQEPPFPALLHGDVWTGNVLSNNRKIAAFLDPAIYFGHPEMELAFITLFDTFGDFFFSRYNQARPIAAGFYEIRRDLYNLYPLLVHVRLFGAGYLSGVDRSLSKCGF
jgi:fructosamine-3-kinase